MFDKFENLEKSNEWLLAFSEIESIIFKFPNNEEAYVRIIYFLHNYLLEESHNTDFIEDFKGKLLRYFNEGVQKFSKNGNFLFFVGKILYISEWYFGVDDDLKPIEDRTAFKMQKKAFELEPNNQLFELAVSFSKGDSDDINRLRKKLVSNSVMLSWLNSYGFPGQYIMDTLIKVGD